MQHDKTGKGKTYDFWEELFPKGRLDLFNLVKFYLSLVSLLIVGGLMGSWYDLSSNADPLFLVYRGILIMSLLAAAVLFPIVSCFYIEKFLRIRKEIGMLASGLLVLVPVVVFFLFNQFLGPVYLLFSAFLILVLVAYLKLKGKPVLLKR